jgi:soluble lytic murein transglycosylase-like protein
MIGKIQPHLSSKPREPGLTRSASGADFEAVLSKWLQSQRTEPNPLDQARINFLRRALEALLSEETQEEPEAFYLPSVLPPVSPPVSSPPSENPVPSNTAQRASQNFEPVIEQAAADYGVDPKLIRAVITTESGGDPRAVSRAGAQGLMQLMPSTAAELGVKDPFDPVQNIMAGSCYLSKLIDRYQGNVQLALAAYNWGMGNLERSPGALPRETREYIARVESTYNSFA